MTDLTSFRVTDGVDYPTAAQYNRNVDSTLRAEISNATTMSGTVTLTDADTPIQRFNCDGANRAVKLPAYNAANHPFFIVNVTGAAYTLDVQSSSAVTLLAAPLQDGEVAYVVPDGTAGFKLVNPKAASAIGDAWTEGIGVWSYSSADAPTFIISINADVTALIGVGDRIKITQSTGGTKYFIVTVVGAFAAGATLVTVYGGTDYTLNNEAISAPFYSHVKHPFGFPADPSKWSVIVTDNTNRTQATATANTWYNIGTVSISIPIGGWLLGYSGAIEDDTGGAGRSLFMTLSTANNSESDADFTSAVSINGQYFSGTAYKNKYITVAAKTPYYMNYKHNNGTITLDAINASMKLVIRATCSYL